MDGRVRGVTGVTTNRETMEEGADNKRTVGVKGKHHQVVKLPRTEKGALTPHPPPPKPGREPITDPGKGQRRCGRGH